MSDHFGWDLIYKVSGNDLKKKEDVMTLVIHFILIRNGYRCIGIGDEKVVTGNEKTSELLPDGWNGSKNYTLRYVRDKDLFILRGVPVDDNIVYNLLRVGNLTVSNAAFNVETTINSLQGPLETMVPKSEEVMAKIKTDLLEPHSSTNSQTATTQTSSSSPPPAPIPCGRPAVPPNYGFPPERAPGVDPFWTDPDRDPLRVGGRDLDPFGRGGGMIFNPFDPRHGGGIPDPGAGMPGILPRGAIPPGARFDPFGPPGIGPRPGPRRPPDSDFPGNMFL